MTDPVLATIGLVLFALGLLGRERVVGPSDSWRRVAVGSLANLLPDPAWTWFQFGVGTLCIVLALT